MSAKFTDRSRTTQPKVIPRLRIDFTHRRAGARGSALEAYQKLSSWRRNAVGWRLQRRQADEEPLETDHHAGDQNLFSPTRSAQRRYLKQPWYVACGLSRSRLAIDTVSKTALAPLCLRRSVEDAHLDRKLPCCDPILRHDKSWPRSR